MTSQQLVTWLLAAVVAPAVAAMDSPLGEWIRGLVDGLPVPLPVLVAAVAAAVGGGVIYRLRQGEVSGPAPSAAVFVRCPARRIPSASIEGPHADKAWSPSGLCFFVRRG